MKSELPAQSHTHCPQTHRCSWPPLRGQLWPTAVRLFVCKLLGTTKFLACLLWPYKGWNILSQKVISRFCQTLKKCVKLRHRRPWYKTWEHNVMKVYVLYFRHSLSLRSEFKHGTQWHCLSLRSEWSGASKWRCPVCKAQAQPSSAAYIHVTRNHLKTRTLWTRFSSTKAKKKVKHCIKVTCL